MRYQDIRLSKHFTLLDFMQDRDTYMSGIPRPAELIPAEHIDPGRSLCQELLEPMMELFGPCSIAAGMCIGDKGPHGWEAGKGAACDAAFHDWVNAEGAPIKLVEHVCNSGTPFERLITYAGSEYVCVAWKATPRFALYENVRMPGHDKPRFVSHAKHAGEFARHPKTFPDRPDWRRGPNEPVYHTRRSLRPQHVRLGRYFSLLDFCRTEIGLSHGIPWVLPINAAEQAYYGRMFAEMLDPLVAKWGRVSITQGVVPTRIARLMGEEGQFYRWQNQQPAKLTFLLPQGTPGTDAMQDLGDEGQNILGLDWREHPSGTTEVTLCIRHFQPRTLWSGGHPYGYFAGDYPEHVPDEVIAHYEANGCDCGGH